MQVKADQTFYSNNWQDFVHLQYLTELMKLIPEFQLPNGETVDSVDNLIVSVDKNGENPISIRYLGKDGNSYTLPIKPEITERVNEIIRDNIKATNNGEDVSWQKISFDKSDDSFKINVLTEDNKVLSTTVPNMTVDDLKQITKINCYDNKIKFTYLEEVDGQLQKQERIYDFNTYVSLEEYNKTIGDINTKLENVGEVHQLSDKACYYDCINHGKIGYCIIYNLGETGNMLINYDIDLNRCLNGSLNPDREWTVTCIPTDLTDDTQYNDQRDWVDTQVELVYGTGERVIVEAQCNVTQVKFTVPHDAVRDNIDHAYMKSILYFEKK